MYNEKKKASNAKYLAKFKTITLRLTDEEKQRIEAAAILAGESSAGYILQAIRQRMEAEQIK